jgi:hypothetical protein
MGATRDAHLRGSRGRRRRCSPCPFSSSRGGALRGSDAGEAIGGARSVREGGKKTQRCGDGVRAREVRETTRERARRVRETRSSISDEIREDASRARTSRAGRAGPPRRRRHGWRSTAQTRIAGGARTDWHHRGLLGLVAGLPLLALPSLLEPGEGENLLRGRGRRRPRRLSRRSTRRVQARARLVAEEAFAKLPHVAQRLQHAVQVTRVADVVQPGAAVTLHRASGQREAATALEVRSRSRRPPRDRVVMPRARRPSRKRRAAPPSKLGFISFEAAGDARCL